jgi:hypothetical protein
MGDVGLFVAGVLITIPAAGGIVSLVVAAIADGRENDRIQAREERIDVPRQSDERTTP